MLKAFLFESKDKVRAAYIWNTSSTILNAFQTVFILMLISRIDPVSDAGIFTIAFAIGNLMMTIGRYGIRQFQVSDVKEKYSFKEYLTVRILTCIATIIVSLGYVGYNYFNGLYDRDKSVVILLVCLAKLVDAFEDVLHGMLQQYNRLDVAGKILTIRLFGYTMTYLVTYFVTQDLILASSAALIASVLLFFLLNIVAVNSIQIKSKQFELCNIGRILKECCSLFISSYFIIYIGNAPKYAIDKVLSNEAQACFNYIFMPVFVISILSQFVYQPVISKIALEWYKGEKTKLGRMIIKQLMIILVLSAIVMIGGNLLGIPVLSLVYGVELSGYKMELMVLLTSGGMLAFVYFFQMIITVTRYQNWLLVGYVTAYLLFVICGKGVVEKHGIMGISLFYVLVISGVAFLFGVITVFIIRKGAGKHIIDEKF